MLDDPRIHVTLDHLRSLEGEARRMSFLPRQPTRSVLNGQHASRLRGRGLNFVEMRGYLPGDDVRAIDWKATARTGSPHVRVFTEERDRPTLLIVDQRMSMFFGSVLNTKAVTAAETAAMVAFGVLAAKDRIGGIVLGEDEQTAFEPKRSSRVLNALLSAVASANLRLHAEREAAPSDGRLTGSLEAAAQLAGHDHLIVVISDFAGADEMTHRALATLARHNDLILALVHDPLAERLPEAGRLVVGDAVLQAEIDFGDTATREAVGEYSRGRLEQVFAWQQQLPLSVLPLSAAEATTPQLRRLLGIDPGAPGTVTGALQR